MGTKGEEDKAGQKRVGEVSHAQKLPGSGLDRTLFSAGICASRSFTERAHTVLLSCLRYGKRFVCKQHHLSQYRDTQSYSCAQGRPGTRRCSCGWDVAREARALLPINVAAMTFNLLALPVLP